MRFLLPNLEGWDWSYRLSRTIIEALGGRLWSRKGRQYTLIFHLEQRGTHHEKSRPTRARDR